MRHKYYIPKLMIMQHRYGRHGPDAWNRWRVRRQARHTQALAVSTTGTTLHFHLVFANREEIFAVKINHEGILEEIARKVIVNAMGNTNQLDDPFYYVRHLARVAAVNKAKNDFKKFGKLLNDQEILAYAEEAWDNKDARERGVSDIAYTTNTSISELLKIYQEEVTITYKQYLKEQGLDITDEQNRDLLNRVYKDKKQNVSHLGLVTGEQLLCQASVSMYQISGINPIEKMNDFKNLVDTYISYYKQVNISDDDAEVDRNNGEKRF